MMLSKYTEIAASDITPYRNPNESNGESDMLLKISKCIREAPVTNENILEMIGQFVANKEYDINCRKDGIDVSDLPSSGRNHLDRKCNERETRPVRYLCVIEPNGFIKYSIEPVQIKRG